MGPSSSGRGAVPSPEAKFASNCHHIARFEVKPRIDMQDGSMVTPAFEALAHGKLTRQLQDPRPAVRTHALVAAREMLAAPLQHTRCIASGMTPVLVKLLQDEDAVARTGAAAALQQLMARGVGLADALQHGALPPLLSLLQQPEDAPRDAAYGALGSAVRHERGRAALAATSGAFTVLLDSANQPRTGCNVSNATAALDVLRACAEARHAEDTRMQLVHVRHAVPGLTAMLRDAPRAVWLSAARLLGVLASTQEDARVQVANAGGVETLCDALTGSDDDMKNAAANALMAVTQSPAGKEALATASGGASAVTTALAVVVAAWRGSATAVQEGNRKLHKQTLIAILQVIANAAELPMCRQRLACTAGTLSELSNGSDEAVSSIAAAALRLVHYCSWPC